MYKVTSVHSRAVMFISPSSVLPSFHSWREQVAVDYDHLINDFGTKHIDAALLDRFEKLTGRKPHMLLRRATFFSHR